MARIVIVGAGLVGLLTGLAASMAGHDVQVVEEAEPGAGASTRNAGVIHPLQPPPGGMRRRLAPRGARAWRRLAPQLGLELYTVDLYMPALTARETLLLPLIGWAVRRLSQGLARPRLLRAKEAFMQEPLLTRRARRVLRVEGYALVDPASLVRRLAERLESLGGEILAGARAERVSCGQKPTLETTRGPLEADYLVNAAGAGAAGLAASAGVRVRVDLVPGVMELFREPRPTSMIAGVPGSPRPESKGGAVIPWPWRGATLYGPSFGGDPGPGGVARRYRRLLREEPEGLVDRIVGYRTVAEGRDFRVVAPPGCPGTVHLLGIESPGLTAAPILAVLALRRLGLEAPAGWPGGGP